MTARFRPATGRGASSAAAVASIAGGLAGAGASFLANRWLDRVVGRRTRLWQRTNHAGRTVSLLEGPAASAGALTGLAVEAILSGRPETVRRTAATAVAVAGAAAVGLYDDLAGTVQAKGFRGHLSALAEGRITSGMIKVAGVGAAAAAATVINLGPRRPTSRAGGRSIARDGADLVINPILIAGSANLINLLDLRPGRAGKMIIGSGAPLLTRPVPGIGPVVGAAAGVLPDDLDGRSMLGDCGANALGAGLGVALTGLPLPARLAALGAVTGLNLASEKVSFSTVIDGNPVLRAMDEYGRPMPRGQATDGPGTGAGRDDDDG